MSIDFSRISNPVIDKGIHEAARDMALLYDSGSLHCVYSSVTRNAERFQWCLAVVR